jgi:hypothetical protein
MSEKNDLPLFKWAEENEKKKEEDKLKKIEEEREEDRAELERLHQYGPGQKPKEDAGQVSEPYPKTNHDLMIEKAHEKALDEDKVRTVIKTLKDKLAKGKK